MRKLNTCLSIIATALVSVSVGHAENWIKDAASGCAIWNPNPTPQETIVWQGPVVDGKASGYGIATWRVKGKKTEQALGQWREGRLHGHAVWTHKSGARYEGEWASGAKNGGGIYTWPDGTMFVGEYRNDQRSHGRVFLPGGAPKDLIPTAESRERAYAAEDSAILARKAATRARIENPRPPTPGKAKAPKKAAKRKPKNTPTPIMPEEEPPAACTPCPATMPEEDPSAK